MRTKGIVSLHLGLRDVYVLVLPSTSLAKASTTSTPVVDLEKLGDVIFPCMQADYSLFV